MGHVLPLVCRRSPARTQGCSGSHGPPSLYWPPPVASGRGEGAALLGFGCLQEGMQAAPGSPVPSPTNPLADWGREGTQVAVPLPMFQGSWESLNSFAPTDHTCANLQRLCSLQGKGPGIPVVPQTFRLLLLVWHLGWTRLFDRAIRGM